MFRPLALVAAIATNGVIGQAGALPWSLPEDMDWFRRITMGKAMIMGRRTWDGIGRPLPGRASVVLTRDSSWRAAGAIPATSLDDAVRLSLGLMPMADEITVIGGAQIYALALPLAQRFYLSEVHADARGDTVFPPFDRSEWAESWRQSGDRVDFTILDRTAMI